MGVMNKTGTRLERMLLHLPTDRELCVTFGGIQRCNNDNQPLFRVKPRDSKRDPDDTVGSGE